jgi:predicted transglutaminase-like cysteine proteinase
MTTLSLTFAHPVGEKLMANAAGNATVQNWNALLDKLAEGSDTHKLKQVNTFFNRHLQYGEDAQIWQNSDYWATPLESMKLGKGDCEDYAIAKYMTLKQLGIDASKLRLIYVKAKIGGADSTVSQAHMVLGYYAEANTPPMILDNMVNDVMPASQRPDLVPVFSFNDAGLWTAGSATPAANSTERLSRWSEVLAKMRTEGF